jgi:hypothetical protein
VNPQRVLWPTTVAFSPVYFQSLMQHAVPLNEHAVARLSHSAMGLDVYTWLAQRLHRVPRLARPSIKPICHESASVDLAGYGHAVRGRPASPAANPAAHASGSIVNFAALMRPEPRPCPLPYLAQAQAILRRANLPDEGLRISSSFLA